MITENELECISKAWDKWKDRDDATLGVMQEEILIQKQFPSYVLLLLQFEIECK
jgi:hypothetical protein